MKTTTAFQAYGTGGTVTASTAREAGKLYFETYPKSRKCNIVQGEKDGNFFTVAYNLRSGESAIRYQDVTKKSLLEIQN